MKFLGVIQISPEQFFISFSKDKHSAVDFLLELDVCSAPSGVNLSTVHEIFVTEEQNPNFIFSAVNGIGDLEISINSHSREFELFCAAKIIQYRENSQCDETYVNLIDSGNLHEFLTDNGIAYADNITDSHSLYLIPDIHPLPFSEFDIRELTAADYHLFDSFAGEPDDFLQSLAQDMIIDATKYSDGRILGAFNHSTLAAYAAHSRLAQIARDVNYIYTGVKYRNNGAASALLSTFTNFCARTSSIAFYSFANSSQSESLALKHGFRACANRQSAVLLN